MTDPKDKHTLVPREFPHYISATIVRFMNRIGASPHSQVALVGFSENMRMMFRLLKEGGDEPILSDWRPKFTKYDCGGKQLVNVDSLEGTEDLLLVICVEDITMIKDAMMHLYSSGLKTIPTIYDRSEKHNPWFQEKPFKGIRERARGRAISMLSEPQLFDLLQYVRNTADVEGDIVEYGSLYGGSGAVIVESALHYSPDKKVWLFDSFAGIPDSRYGLDHHWNGSFSDSSYAAVRDAFKDVKNTTVVQGNIVETYDKVEGSISFGYLASNTLESGEVLLNYMWPKLSKGGIITICDYGSFPNAIPLTMYCDEFFKGKKDAFIYHPASVGLVAMKKQSRPFNQKSKASQRLRPPY